MSWLTLLTVAVGAYVFKALGLVVLGARTLPRPMDACLDLLPAALISAIVIVNTFGAGRRLVLDARAVGLAVAVIATWRKLPFPVILVLAAAAAAITRKVNV